MDGLMDGSGWIDSWSRWMERQVDTQNGWMAGYIYFIYLSVSISSIYLSTM